jgi:hypothetical protein
MYEITKGEVYDFYRKDDNYKKFSKTEFAEKLLLEIGLDIKTENEISQLVNGSELFSSASKILVKRLARFIEDLKTRKKKFSSDDLKWNDTFFDLRDFPELIKEEISQNEFSQSSTASRISNSSDLEIEIPSKPRTKRSFPFSEVGPKAKTMRTKEVFDLLLETAERENLPPEKLAAYLGYRVSYQKNKTLAAKFKSIFEEGRTTEEVEPVQALFIREHCQIGRRVYTGTAK